MTLLGLYKYLFTTELLVAEWLFTFRLEKRKRFIWRALGGIALCYLLTALFPLFDDKYNGWYVSFMFLVLFAATFGAVAFSYDVPLKNAFFLLPYGLYGATPFVRAFQAGTVAV